MCDLMIEVLLSLKQKRDDSYRGYGAFHAPSTSQEL